MNDDKMFSPETLRDEYHESLKKCMDSLLIIDSVKRRVIGMRIGSPDRYIALAALAHEHGYAALYLGLRLIFPEDLTESESGS